MALTFIAKDPNTDGANCPTVWVDQEKQEFVIQGWKADDATTAECLTTGPIPDSETVLRLPVRMAAALKEAIDVAEGTRVR
ncbi:hypothetical protein [Streptomyces sp. LS1784]|uniref:hypothetical protein n=1 Tax=Streptomyces sp. LS1784 TaxID=2851533 RepID=UPI001CCD90B3|nr:hypothetical protein [Streptomyces sp. LS1784]